MYKIIEELYGWKISQCTHSGEFGSKWFAGRELGDQWNDALGDWIDEHEYIHPDGVARKSLCNNGEYTGYFDTKEAVVDAILKHHSPTCQPVLRSESDEHPDDKKTVAWLLEYLRAECNHWDGVNSDRYWQTVRILQHVDNETKRQVGQ